MSIDSKGDGFREKLVAINRVSTTTAGGRSMSFTALVVVGANGMIGVGLGKGREVPDAIRKAMEQGRKDMKHISLNGGTTHYPIKSKYNSSKVFIQPASKGTGVIAGGPMRAVFEVLGVTDIIAKVLHGATNPINVVKATVNGLLNAEDPAMIAQKRGRTKVGLRRLQKREANE